MKRYRWPFYKSVLIRQWWEDRGAYRVQKTQYAIVKTNLKLWLERLVWGNEINESP